MKKMTLGLTLLTCLILSLLAFLIFSCTVHASDEPPFHSAPGGHRLFPPPPRLIPDILFMDVDLTAAQISAISTLRESFLKEILPIKSKIAEEMTTLSQPGKEGSANARYQQWERIGAMQEELQKKRAEYMKRALAILTPDQAARLVLPGFRPNRPPYGIPPECPHR